MKQGKIIGLTAGVAIISSAITWAVCKVKKQRSLEDQAKHAVQAYLSFKVHDVSEEDLRRKKIEAEYALNQLMESSGKLTFRTHKVLEELWPQVFECPLDWFKYK